MAREEKRGLTMREADGGYAPRFLAFFTALRFHRFGGESTLPPQAGNTSCQVADTEKERIILRKTNE
jgi:hypothetical protein